MSDIRMYCKKKKKLCLCCRLLLYMLYVALGLIVGMDFEFVR